METKHITVPKEKVGKEEALPKQTGGVDDIRKATHPSKGSCTKQFIR